MKILGLDIAAKTGWAVIDTENKGFSEWGFRVLGHGGPEHCAARLHSLRELITSLWSQWHPELIAVEDAAFGSKNQFFTQLGHAEYRGVAKLVARDLGASHRMINPASWKAWLTGSGRADKQQTMRALAGQFCLAPEDDNAADALAIALAAASGVGMPKESHEKQKQPTLTFRRRAKGH